VDLLLVHTDGRSRAAFFPRARTALTLPYRNDRDVDVDVDVDNISHASHSMSLSNVNFVPYPELKCILAALSTDDML
jgi:hypothetical protein